MTVHDQVEMLATSPPSLVPRASESEQVMDLFRRAFEGGGATPEALAQLVALHERVDRRKAELEFAGALVKFQQSCPPVKRTTIRKLTTTAGTAGPYRYADLEEILDTVQPHLTPLGLALTFDGEPVGDRADLWRCTVTLRHVNGHSIEAHSTVPIESKSPAMSAQDRFVGANTNAKRQCIIAVLGLNLTDPMADVESEQPRITEEQEATLEALITETKTKKDRILAWQMVGALSEMKASNYDRVVAYLEKQRGTA